MLCARGLKPNQEPPGSSLRQAGKRCGGGEQQRCRVPMHFARQLSPDKQARLLYRAHAVGGGGGVLPKDGGRCTVIGEEGWRRRTKALPVCDLSETNEAVRPLRMLMTLALGESVGGREGGRVCTLCGRPLRWAAFYLHDRETANASPHAMHMDGGYS